MDTVDVVTRIWDERSVGLIMIGIKSPEGSIMSRIYDEIYHVGKAAAVTQAYRIDTRRMQIDDVKQSDVLREYDAICRDFANIKTLEQLPPIQSRLAALKAAIKA